MRSSMLSFMNEKTEINSTQRPCQGHTLTQGENSSPTLITLCWEPSRLYWVPFPRRLQWSGQDWCWHLRTKDTGGLGIMLDTGSSKDSCDRMWSHPPGPDSLVVSGSPFSDVTVKHSHFPLHVLWLSSSSLCSVHGPLALAFFDLSWFSFNYSFP